MKNWQCGKCHEVIQSMNRPMSGKCPATIHGNSSSGHNWEDMGETGSETYQCDICGLLLKSNRPYSGKCPETIRGNSSSGHRWRKG